MADEGAGRDTRGQVGGRVEERGDLAGVASDPILKMLDFGEFEADFHEI